MTLWFRLRGWWRVVLAVGATELLVCWAGGVAVPVPNLQGFAAPVPAALLAPLALAVACAWALTHRVELESAASRAVRVLDATGVLAVVVVVLIIGAGSDAVGNTTLGVAAARNTAGYVGLALIGRAVLGGQASSALPAGFLLLSTLLGYSPERLPRWWAFPLAAGGDLAAATVAAAVFVTGVLLLLGGDNRRRRAAP